MGQIRSEISEKSPYYISKYRFLELKNFCRQYPDWVRELKLVNWYGIRSDIRGVKVSDRTEALAEKVASLNRRLEMVEQAAIAADPDIYQWIVKGVSEGIGYLSLGVPCSKDYYYDRYRRFFWYLDKIRG